MTATTNEAIEFWKLAINEQSTSGLTVAEYCQLIEKSTYQFYYWKRRVGDDPSQAYGTRESEPRGFIEIQSAPIGSRNREARSDQVDIRIGSFLIRCTEHTKRELFREAASVLREVVE